MTATPLDVLRAIDDELHQIDVAIQEILRIRQASTQQTQQLAEQSTEAFVDLSKHYLPELNQQTLANAWREVKSEINDVLLRKRDHRRRLKSKVGDVQNLLAELASRRTQTQAEVERTKLILSCKTGNFRKLLREDPQVQRCMDEIDALDQDIECYLAHQESIEADARQKLPSYEQSSLFEYLKEQNYGTPQYAGQGIERRWDRWVARLIDYRNAKKSYDFLLTTPEHLKELIDEKQSRYRNLLAQLHDARHRAATRHGTREQKSDWQAWCSKAADLDEQIDEAKWESSVLLGELDDLESPNGEYYVQALTIYQDFLRQLDPDVMRVYAECTCSPVDDEICARLRNVQNEILQQQAASIGRFKELASFEKQAATLRELSTRLHTFQREALGEVDFGADFDASSFLQRVCRRSISLDEAWQSMCESMLLPDVNDKQRSSKAAGPMLPMEATFAAASESSTPSPSNYIGDVNSIVLMPAPTDVQKEAFSTMAILRSRKEAKRMAKLLADADIPCFVHTHTFGIDADGDEEVDIVVANQRYDEALQIVRCYQRSVGQPRICKTCHSQVDSGHRRCWHCGQSQA